MENNKEVQSKDQPPIKAAIYGTGSASIALTNYIISNPSLNIQPICFIDPNTESHREVIYKLPVINLGSFQSKYPAGFEINEIILPTSDFSLSEKQQFFTLFNKMNLIVKLFEISNDGSRTIRPLEIEDLLFPSPYDFITSNESITFYRGKTILVTGSAGALGPELCRQLVDMLPKKLVILNMDEKNAYNLQCELVQKYKTSLSLSTEIVSFTNGDALARIFDIYKPDIVFHTAIYNQDTPNSIEAVKNNIFGTLNLVLLSKIYKVKLFVFPSSFDTAKSHNIYNTTIRICEMIVNCYGKDSEGPFYAVRYGKTFSTRSMIHNIRKQIGYGGPVTITDKRAVCTLVTYYESMHFLLESGHIAKHGYVYFLDIGKTIRVLDLAESMIRLAGYVPYKDINIEELGLRPDEHLYEEFSINSSSIENTGNKQIFRVKDTSLTHEELGSHLSVLEKALELKDEKKMKLALHNIFSISL